MKSLINYGERKKSTMRRKSGKTYYYLLPKGKWNIFVLNHVMYLPPHGKSKQYNPVEKEYWPKHRHIKYAEECEEESNAESFCDGVP